MYLFLIIPDKVPSDEFQEKFLSNVSSNRWNFLVDDYEEP